MHLHSEAKDASFNFWIEFGLFRVRMIKLFASFISELGRIQCPLSFVDIKPYGLGPLILVPIYSVLNTFGPRSASPLAFKKIDFKSFTYFNTFIYTEDSVNRWILMVCKSLVCLLHLVSNQEKDFYISVVANLVK